MRALLALVLLLLCAVPLRAAVWIVDAAGGGTFTDLPAAVAAAAPGDTLLVRDGRYRGANITRGLRVIASAAPPVVELESPLVIRDLPANERVLVRGVGFRSCSFGLTVLRCAGVVTIEEMRMSLFCAIFSQPSGWTSVAPNLQIVDSAQVVLRECTFPGSRTSSGMEVPGAELLRSAVWMYDVQISGVWGYTCGRQAGGLALRATQSRLLLSGCRITGGYGSGGGACFQLDPPCYHGPGTEAFDAPGTDLWDFGSIIQGGANGTWHACIAIPPPVYANAWRTSPRTHLRELEALPRLAGSALLPMGRTASFTVELASAHPQVLFVGFTPARLELPGLAGTLWLDPFHAFPIGITSANLGTATISFPVENDPLALGWELYFQAVDIRGRFGAPTSGVLQ
ncbi:MAG: hypothetical protein IPN34_22840 [Planctomycetes bacterium]|nr:hypothetical protein [Planctomycetota bacterium]